MNAVWTTADYALIVSLSSATLSLFGLGWNIWSKFIYPKPRLEVSISFTIAVGPGTDHLPPVISVVATNHGPSEITIQSLVGLVRSQRVFTKRNRALFRTFDNWPFSLATSLGNGAGLPKRLPVGERCTVYVPYKGEDYGAIETIGFADGFGREHFAAGRSRRNFLKHLKQSQ